MDEVAGISMNWPIFEACPVCGVPMEWGEGWNDCHVNYPCLNITRVGSGLSGHCFKPSFTFSDPDDLLRFLKLQAFQ